MIKFNTASSLRKSKGITMVEVLVSILVVSIGLLGYAGLLARSVKNNQSSYFRSQATFHAYDIIDCIRANKIEALAGSYNIAIGSLPTSSNMASEDIFYWKNNLSQNLPEGDGSVLVDVKGNITISIQWKDGGSKNDDSNTIFMTQTSL